MSNAFTALIWWLIPLAGLLGALGYVLWVSKFQGKFEQETTRSVTSFPEVPRFLPRTTGTRS